MRVHKVRPGNKIAILLRAAQGQPVPIECIVELMKSDATLSATEYKLSGYVGDIRKYDDGIVVPEKTGRKVISYLLRNYEEFNESGQNLNSTFRQARIYKEEGALNTVGVPYVKSTEAVEPVTSTVETTESVVEPVVETEIVSTIVTPSDDTVEIESNGDPTMSDAFVHDPQPEMVADVTEVPKLDRNARRRYARAAARAALQLAA